MKALTKKHAIELSILKWEFIVENNGSSFGLIEIYPELKSLMSYCGLCHKYNNKLGGKFNSCYGCPLVMINNNYNYNECGCSQREHLYRNWFYDRTKVNAQKLLDFLKIILAKDEIKRKRLNKIEAAKMLNDLELSGDKI